MTGTQVMITPGGINRIIITYDSLLWDLLKENNLTNSIGKTGGHLAITKAGLDRIVLYYATTYLGDYTTDEIDEVDNFIATVAKEFKLIEGDFYTVFYLIHN